MTNRPVILDSMLCIPEETLTEKQLKSVIKSLTLRLPDSGGYGFGDAGPASLTVYKRNGDGYISVPRNWWGARDFIRGHPFEDRRSNGTPIGLKFKGKFRSGQKQFVDQLIQGLKEDGLGAIAQAACGFGKTACATAAISLLDTTTLFVVHKEKLMKQFIDSCEKFLGYTPGVIQGSRCEFEGKKICVGMIQSLHQRTYPKELYDYFGLVTIDESHRVAAPTFSAAIEKFNSKYRLGLTATPRRGDKMENIFYWHLGNIACVGRGQFLDCQVTVIQWEPQIHPNQWQFRGKPNLGRLITSLSKDHARTAMHVSLIAKATRAGRKSLVLSDRCAHLEDVRNRLQKSFKEAGEAYTVGIFAAGSTKKIRAARKAALSADVMCGTWAMASEGLDSPERDAVFFLTPKADVEQASGRIRRLYEGKKIPRIIDTADNIGFLNGFSRKRMRFYTTSGIDKNPWPVQLVSRIAP